MTTFNPTNRSQVRAFQQEAVAALQDLAARHGVRLQPWGGTMSDDHYDMKIRVHTTPAYKPGKKPQSQAVLREAQRHGLDPTLQHQGIRLLDYNYGAPKYPWVIEDTLNGRQQRATLGWVKARFKDLRAAA